MSKTHFRMAENKKSFLMYCDWIHSIRELTNEEAGIILKHLLSYVNDENPNLEERTLRLVFEPIKQQLKRDLKKYEGIKEKRSNAGRVGGLASGEARSKDKQDEPNEANASFDKQTKQNEHVTVNDNDNGTVNVNDNATKVKYVENEFSTLYKKVNNDTSSISKFIIDNNPDIPEPFKDLWNLFAQKYTYPQISKMTKARLTSLKNRLKEPEFKFVEVLKMASKSKGLTGAGWFSFDFLIKNDTNYIKVLEGKYLEAFGNGEKSKSGAKPIKLGARTIRLTPEQLAEQAK